MDIFIASHQPGSSHWSSSHLPSSNNNGKNQIAPTFLYLTYFNYILAITN